MSHLVSLKEYLLSRFLSRGRIGTETARRRPGPDQNGCGYAESASPARTSPRALSSISAWVLDVIAIPRRVKAEALS